MRTPLETCLQLRMKTPHHLPSLTLLSHKQADLKTSTFLSISSLTLQSCCTQNPPLPWAFSADQRINGDLISRMRRKLKSLHSSNSGTLLQRNIFFCQHCSSRTLPPQPAFGSHTVPVTLSRLSLLFCTMVPSLIPLDCIKEQLWALISTNQQQLPAEMHLGTFSHPENLGELPSMCFQAREDHRDH